MTGVKRLECLVLSRPKLFRSFGTGQSTEVTAAKPKKEMIWALKKEKGQGLRTEDSDADAGFEVLALMHKSNARFTLKHFRDVDQSKPEAEAEDDDKHLKPQHR